MESAGRVACLRALQSLQTDRLSRRVAAGGSSSHGIRCPFRVLCRLRNAGYWFPVPTSSLDLPSTVWFSAADIAGTVLAIPDIPLFGFRVPPESYPADPSRTGARSAWFDHSLELSFPSALASFEDPLSRVCHARFGPSSGFGYPHDGLRPSKPGRPCFMPTALLGFFTPFEAFSSQKVPEAVTPPGEPACR